MCGFCGSVEANGHVDVDQLVRSTRVLEHRGPDAEGFLIGSTSDRTVVVRTTRSGERFTDPPAPTGAGRQDIAFGFRRLAIVDVSHRGNQPMGDPDGRAWIVFNGEIYNHIELRAELEAHGVRFNSATDTEVLLNAYLIWGESFVERLEGMWAFAIWDTCRRSLHLSRDRFGIKPLYYATTQWGLRFGSEIKALLEDREIVPRANDAQLLEFLSTSRANHTADTMFTGICQVTPATVMTWDLERVHEEPISRAYWTLDPSARLRLTDIEYSSTFAELLRSSVRHHLRSDVPIGTCLSGGLDSSTIVCMVNSLLRDEGVAAEQLGDRQRTFTSSFDDPSVDEREYALEVVRQTGAASNLVFPDAARLVEDLPKLVWHQDEPFGGTSIYAQWSVFRAASEHGLKVMLDGQGSDEMLAGYQGFHQPHLLSLVARMHLVRALAEGRASGQIAPTARWALGIARSRIPFHPRALARRITGRPAPTAHQWFNAEAVARLTRRESWRERTYADLFDERLYRELRDGLPSLLRFEDRDSMAFSIEARVPFLDHKLVEFAFALPESQKIRNGLRKHVLREATRTILPEKVRTRRDKLGFATPETTWFRSHLADRAVKVFADPPEVVARLVCMEPIKALAERTRTSSTTLDEQSLVWRVLNACDWANVFGVTAQ